MISASQPSAVHCVSSNPGCDSGFDALIVDYEVAVHDVTRTETCTRRPTCAGHERHPVEHRVAVNGLAKELEMSKQSKAMAMELANKKLMESMEIMKGELAQLKNENKDLTEKNVYLASLLESEKERFSKLKSEHERTTGRSYSGAMNITKFGFSKNS